MQKDKNVNLTLSFKEFSRLLVFANANTNISDIDFLRDILNAKFDKIIEHDLYTKYKTAPTEEQREQARLEYLEKKNISANFRY